MTAPAIPTREDITAAWLLCGNAFDVSRALAERSAMLDQQQRETLMRATAIIVDDAIDFDAPEVCGCDDCLRKEAVR